VERVTKDGSRVGGEGGGKAGRACYSSYLGRGRSGCRGDLEAEVESGRAEGRKEKKKKEGEEER